MYIKKKKICTMYLFYQCCTAKRGILVRLGDMSRLKDGLRCTGKVNRLQLPLQTLQL